MLKTILLLTILIVPLVARACPDLTPYYPGSDTDWAALEAGLSELEPECLESPEYFALLGAARLNGGRVAEAVESLERALLLDPNNGSAQVDYAQALFLQGDLFAALELNERLLQRDDLPANLKPLLENRASSWRSVTRQKQFQLDFLAGYDTNLNSAPQPDEITLTLSGEDVVLALNPEFQPISGPYLNARFGARFRQLAPRHQHNWLLEARSRVSEDSESDLVQLDTRYSFVRPGTRRSWQLNAGMSHLFFGGGPLYTATDMSARYIVSGGGLTCRPYYGIALQHQLFHDDNRLDALEGKLSSGLNCPFQTPGGLQQLVMEVALLENNALDSGRPGGSRHGWQASINWRMPLLAGEFVSQLTHTQFDDRDGYNPLLDNGADRWLNRSYILLQYRRPLTDKSAFLLNFFHQNQRSNIDLFDSDNTTLEVGLSLLF